MRHRGHRLAHTMRAALIRTHGEPDVVEIAEVDEPLIGPDSVQIEVAASSVNPVDWKVVAGYLTGAIPHHLPLIPGWDVAGTVRAVGPAVTTVAVGDRVAAYDREDHVQHGTYAELTSVPERTVARIPDGVTNESAGALPLAGLTAAQALAAVGVRAGDTVLVHAAAGGVGSLAVQLAGYAGARVIGTSSPANHAYLRELGAEPVAYGDRLVDGVRELAPDGVDVVVDLIGGDALAATPKLLADSGRVVSIVDAATVAELGGTYVFVRGRGGQLGELLTLVADGTLRVEIAETYPLERAADALRASMGGHVRGKVAISV